MASSKAQIKNKANNSELTGIKKQDSSEEFQWRMKRPRVRNVPAFLQDGRWGWGRGLGEGGGGGGDLSSVVERQTGKFKGCWSGRGPEIQVEQQQLTKHSVEREKKHTVECVSTGDSSAPLNNREPRHLAPLTPLKPL